MKGEIVAIDAEAVKLRGVAVCGWVVPAVGGQGK